MMANEYLFTKLGYKISKVNGIEITPEIVKKFAERVFDTKTNEMKAFLQIAYGTKNVQIKVNGDITEIYYDDSVVILSTNKFHRYIYQMAKAFFDVEGAKTYRAIAKEWIKNAMRDKRYH